MNDDSIMKYESILPEDYNGVFYFTNWTDEDFVGVWGSKEYHFPKLSTSPMHILDASPLETQHIRKKFAKNLAEQVFHRSDDFKKRYLSQERNSDGTPRLNSIHQAGTYTLGDLTPLIQRCLEPLPIANARVFEAPKEKIEDILSRNDEGELNTEVVGEKTSLKAKALSK